MLSFACSIFSVKGKTLVWGPYKKIHWYSFKNKKQRYINIGQHCPSLKFRPHCVFDFDALIALVRLATLALSSWIVACCSLSWRLCPGPWLWLGLWLWTWACKSRSSSRETSESDGRLVYESAEPCQKRAIGSNSKFEMNRKSSRKSCNFQFISFLLNFHFAIFSLNDLFGWMGYIILG